MLRLDATGSQVLWDSLLPEQVKVLPTDLAQIDLILNDPGLLEPFRIHFAREAAQSKRQVIGWGRPTIPMQTYVRLMVVKHRTEWGYETLMQEVSDSIHLRRFCLIGLDQPVPDESTVRKLTRRLGDKVVDELTRGLIRKARREARFKARAMRVDSTVVEADIRYPTDSGLCLDAVKTLARAARKLTGTLSRTPTRRVQDRSRAVNRRIRQLSRTLRRRTEEGKKAVQRLTEECATLTRRSLNQARKLAEEALKIPASRGRAAAKQRALNKLNQLSGLSAKVVEQIRRRFAGEPITDRLVSIHDPDARPIRRGKLGKPNEFGYLIQLSEITSNTKPGARGLLLPTNLIAGAATENTLLPDTINELKRLGLNPKEAVFDAGFQPAATQQAFTDLNTQIYIAGRTQARSRKTARRLQRYRTGSEGRIAHHKREYGGRRSRLRQTDGATTWEAWGILAYNLDTLTLMPSRKKE